MTRSSSYFPLKDEIAAKVVSERIKSILGETKIPEDILAQSLGLSKMDLSVVMSRKAGFYRECLYPLKRLLNIMKFAKTSLSEKGIREWLLEPNPGLKNVAPIFYLSSDRKMNRVISLLGAIRHGLS